LFNKVEICGVNTSKLKILSEDEKTDLLKKAKQGNSFAREELINGNLRLVLSVIQRFCGKKDSSDDLFQVGCIGLIKAVDNFDISQSVKFSTYAVPMIIGEVRRYLRDNNMIRVSRSVRELAYKALNEKEKLAIKLGREATVEEICESVNKVLFEALQSEEEKNDFKRVSQKEIAAALEAVVDPVSLYDPLYSDSGDSLYIMDQIFDTKNNAENWTENIALTEAFKKLSYREKNILDMRFYKDKTQMEVAKEINISQAQVSRVEKNALMRIKKQMN